MKNSSMLKLPYRAGEIVPPDVARLLPIQQGGVLAIAGPRRRRQKKVDSEGL